MRGKNRDYQCFGQNFQNYYFVSILSINNIKCDQRNLKIRETYFFLNKIFEKFMGNVFQNFI